jgi:protease IV
MMTTRMLRIGLLTAAIAFLTCGCGPTSFMVTPVPATQQLQETQIQRDEGLWVTDKIAVIDVDGMMINMRQGGFLQAGDNPVSLFLEKIDRARNDPAVKAVVLRLNSPGGTVSASDMMYHALLEFKRTSHKPVIACMLDVAASGAYYLACGSDGIMAQPTTVTGSIGTIMQTVSFAGTMQKLGIKAEAIKSGDLKDMASPLHDLGPREREILQNIIQQFYQNFLTVVLAGRNNLTRDKLLPLADGRVFTADQALKEGLIDKIGYPGEAIAWAKEKAHLIRIRVVIYNRPFGYKPNVYASASENIGPASLINVELPSWLRSEGPAFLYLWQPASE